MKEFRIIFQPGAISQQVAAGTSIMEAMNQAGLESDFPCGGMGKCGKCRVQVIEGLEEPTSIDRARLTLQELNEGIQLGLYNGDP